MTSLRQLVQLELATWRSARWSRGRRQVARNRLVNAKRMRRLWTLPGLVGLGLLAWQLPQENPADLVVVLGGALVVPWLASWDLLR
jgi:hypothetical protein